MSRTLGMLLLAWALACGGSAALAATDSAALILVARPDFDDPLYGESILFARAIGDGAYVGFIINRPTDVTLADAFPGHRLAKTARAPLYLGGPDEVDAIFALVASHASPGRGAVQLLPDVYLVSEPNAVARMVDAGREEARFFAGAVLWQAGELDEELRQGSWYVLEPEPDLVLPRSTEGLWQRLVERAKLREKGI